MIGGKILRIGAAAEGRKVIKSPEFRHAFRLHLKQLQNIHQRTFLTAAFPASATVAEERQSGESF